MRATSRDLLAPLARHVSDPSGDDRRDDPHRLVGKTRLRVLGDRDEDAGPERDRDDGHDEHGDVEVDSSLVGVLGLSLAELVLGFRLFSP